jgi:hypothetical protein
VDIAGPCEKTERIGGRGRLAAADRPNYVWQTKLSDERLQEDVPECDVLGDINALGKLLPDPARVTLPELVMQQQPMPDPFSRHVTLPGVNPVGRRDPMKSQLVVKLGVMLQPLLDRFAGHRMGDDLHTLDIRVLRQ